MSTSKWHEWKVVCYVVLLLASVLAGAQEALPGRDTLQVPDVGWKLWPDTKAAWKDDTLYLPSDVVLATLPVNPPTGGWSVLDVQGISVTLPTTVEQHYWGKLGQRPYTRNEYSFSPGDPEVMNSNYEGVSWWWRSIDIPPNFAGKVIVLHLRGARQRAEIYVNQKLVGYDLIGETAFDTDISTAIVAGKSNQIAIRITNPGGRLDWRDYNAQKWGKYEIQKGLGFGGIDRGITISAHDPVYLSDTWVLNKPDPQAISANATVRNLTDHEQAGTLTFNVVDRVTGKVQSATSLPAVVAKNSSKDFSANLRDTAAKLWDVDSPNLYWLRAEWKLGKMADTRTINFGFRWIEPRGVGTNAGLYLNGKRIRLYTSISWGFWGLNGLWPTPELARKEVSTAKALGLNTLNFHRNIGKEEVLADQDEMGLMRYMEPGGGVSLVGPNVGRDDSVPPGEIDSTGKGGEPNTFLQRYTSERTLRMVKMFRSHPSLIMYVVQNETEPDITKPQVWNILRTMNEMDPSRITVAKSGISYKHQAWFAPYSDIGQHDDGTGYSGWRDEHTVGGPGVWTDDLYQDDEHFTHLLNDPKEIVDWGEMLGAGTPDHHDLMVKQIIAAGGESYDLRDHMEIDAAYNKFLDNSGLRSSFPTSSSVYEQAGRKAFEFWGRVIETARLSDSNDILSISGWESTAVEDHSGLVDNLRNAQGNVKLLAPHMAALLPVVRPRGLVHRVGEGILADVYLLNETGHKVSGKLELSIVGPDGKRTELGTWPAPEYVQNHFVYPVKMAVGIPAEEHEGMYRLTLRLSGTMNAENSESMELVSPTPKQMPQVHVALVGDSVALGKALNGMPSVRAEIFKPDGHYDLILARQLSRGRVNRNNDGVRISNTEDDTLYRSSISGSAGSFTMHFGDLPAGRAKVFLYFAEVSPIWTTHRVFDVQLNHKTVAADFDIVKEAHGINTAVVKTFDVDTVNGGIDLGSGKSKNGDAIFNAIKIEVGGKTFAYSLGGDDYTDKSGLLWRSYVPASDLSAAVLEQVKSGVPMMVIASDVGAGTTVALELAKAGAFKFDGPIPTARAAWMGSWVFVGKHALFDGLPQEEVMHGDYQFSVLHCYGLQVQGPNVHILAGYGRDHSRALGASVFTTTLGKGTVLFDGLVGSGAPVVETRLLANAISYLSKAKP